VSSDGTWTYTFDAAGNLIKKSKGSAAETWTYGYDNANQMTWSEQRATDGGTLLQREDYAYDVDGHRLSKAVTVSGVTTVTRWGYDGSNAWATLDGSSGLVTRQLFGNVVDQLFAQESASGTPSWYLTDRQGSTRLVVDSSGALQDELWYSGFGQVTTETAPTAGFNYQYAGGLMDRETGLELFWHRYLDPVTLRFTSEDPTGFTPDSNPYRYTHNGPTDATDPTGLEEIKVSRNNVFWVIQEKRWYWNKDVRFVNIGTLNGDEVAVDDSCGGGTASLSDLRALASKYWNQCPDMSDLPQDVQDFRVDSAVRRVAKYKNPIRTDSAAMQVTKAALTGTNDGSKFVLDELSMHKIDAVHDAAVKAEADYDKTTVMTSRISGVVAREALVTAATGGFMQGGGKLLAKGAGKAAGALVEAGYVSKNTVCAVQTGGKILVTGGQVYGTVKQAEALGEKLDAAYDAYKRGDEEGMLRLLAEGGVETVSLGYSVQDLADLAKQLGKVGFKNFFLSCFAAGTPLLTPGEARRIEDLRVGDLVLSRPEDDPAGRVEAKLVEAVFARMGRIMELRVGGSGDPHDGGTPVLRGGRGLAGGGGVAGRRPPVEP